MSDLLTIGDVARRSGVATSALRFYETKGLIRSERTAGNQRRYERSTIRIVSVIKAAQRLGVGLDEIAERLDTLPSRGAPTAADWAEMARGWQVRLDDRIAALQRLRDNLTGCIGCGCLSMERCALWNPGDGASDLGEGPRYLFGDEPPQSRGSGSPSR